MQVIVIWEIINDDSRELWESVIESSLYEPPTPSETNPYQWGEFWAREREIIFFKEILIRLCNQIIIVSKIQNYLFIIYFNVQ